MEKSRIAAVRRTEKPKEFEDSVVHRKAGDVVVQRGTIHNWVKPRHLPCTIAFILVDGKPSRSNGKILHAAG